MLAGILGVPLGSYLSQKVRPRLGSADPLICGGGLLLSAPLFLAAMAITASQPLISYTLVFFAQLALNLNWAIVADMLLVRLFSPRDFGGVSFFVLFGCPCVVRGKVWNFKL